MPGNFTSPDGDLESIFVNDYAMIDQYAGTGSLWNWGNNSFGFLGDNTTVSKSSPVQTIAGGTNWKSVSVGSYHTASIKTDGTLWGWGTNSYGQLATGNLTHRSSPVQTVSTGTNWKSVSAGFMITSAIKTDGTLWGWGQNTYGQLGNNTITNRSSPVQTISAGNNWALVSSGGYITAAIKTDGTLWVWGKNSFGQLGDGTITHRSSPIQTIAGGTNWKAVSAGFQHTAAIKKDGSLWVWGENIFGTLGTNNTTSQSSPVQTVAGGTNWKFVSCGYRVMAAIKTDGTLWVWGSNSEGQLGDNTTTGKSSPVQTIAAGTNWKQVSFGGQGSSSAAIKTDGTLWVWGSNATGQLGINSQVIGISSPVQTVAGGTNWKQCSAPNGGASSMAAIYFYDAGDLYPDA